MDEAELQVVDDSANLSEDTVEAVEAPVEIVIESNDGTELVDVDVETAKKLKDAGIELETVDPTDTDDAETMEQAEKVQEPGAIEDVQAADEPLTQPGDAEFQQPEYVKIDGQLHKVDEIVKSRMESATKIREQGQQMGQLGTLQNAFDMIMRDPEGAKLVSRLSTGQAAPQVASEIPTENEQFQDWLGRDLPGNMAAFVQQQNGSIIEELRRQGQAQNSILAHLEGQIIENKYDLEPLQPYLDQISQELGVQAQYMPQEMKILLAEGLRARSDAATTANEQQTEEQRLEAETKHREKVTAAAVEPANSATGVAPKIVDFASLTAQEKRQYLIERGVQVADRD